jgi:hypothetical protein
MVKIRYPGAQTRFYDDKAALLPHVQAVIEEYAAAGFKLNPRGVAYRLEGTGVITKTDENFQQVEDVVKQGRMMGLIDWDLIQIGGDRAFSENPTWNGPKDRLQAAAKTYNDDKWARQKRRAYVLTEKVGLRGILEPVADEYDVPVRPCKGYDGLGDIRATALRIMAGTPGGRLLRAVHNTTEDGSITLDEAVAGWSVDDDSDQDQQAVVLFVGDHDPSGLDLERDVQAKLDTFGAAGLYELKRVAVTCDETCQADEIELHSNPAKESDKRWPGYIAAGHTDQAWEVESIEPTVLAARVREAILAEVDVDQWQTDVDQQESDRGRISALADDWDGDEEE